MLQTQHLYSHQQQYNQHEPSAWQHNGPQLNHQLMNHGPQQAQAQLAAAAQQQQQQQYSRLAANPNHNASHVQNANRQALAENAQISAGMSLSTMNDQSTGVADQQLSEENRKVLQWVAELLDPTRREGALMELSKKREQVPELALVLWHSFGVMTSLLQEIISVYPLLNPSQLTAAASNRVCNALALLQCVASHNETRGLFLNGMCPHQVLSWILITT
jgi:CCR4-NOT transcription complex subunit 9